MEIRRGRWTAQRAEVAGARARRVIRGTAVVFNTRSVDLGGFVEVIRPEAIRRTLEEQIDLRAFIDHDPTKVLGRLSAGTLRVATDGHGLHVEIDPPKRTDADDLLESLQRGDVSGMSFAFRTLPDGEDWRREAGQMVRYVTDMRVQEVSVVSLPAYPATDVEVAQRALARQSARPTIAQLRAAAAARAARW
jgi:HK97 family phage prohead protease